MKSLALPLLAGLVLCTTAAQAQTLVTYLNTTTTGTGTATQVDPSLTAGLFTLPNLGSTANVGFSGVNSISNVYLRTDFIAATEAQAVLDARFMFFTLTPVDPLSPVTMTQISFEMGTSSATPLTSPAVTANAFVRSSLDNYASTIGTTVGFTNISPPAHTSWGTTRVLQTVNLGAEFQNITSAVTFRIYFIDNVSDSNTSLRITNVQVIPEPSSLGLLGLGAAGLAFVRARRRRQSA